MKARVPHLLGAAIAALSTSMAFAGERLTEISPVQRVQGRASWETLQLRADDAGKIAVRVPPWDVRLAIPPKYRTPPGRIRIFLVIPIQVTGLRGAGGFEISWQTQGRFLSGQGRPGDRVLLFEGPAEGTVMGDVISFTLRMPGTELIGPLDYETIYEIEEAP